MPLRSRSRGHTRNGLITLLPTNYWQSSLSSFAVPERTFKGRNIGGAETFVKENAANAEGLVARVEPLTDGNLMYPMGASGPEQCRNLVNCSAETPFLFHWQTQHLSQTTV